MDAPTDLRVAVHEALSGRPLCVVEVQATATVATLKALIAKVAGVPGSKHVLMSGVVPLTSNEALLSDLLGACWPADSGEVSVQLLRRAPRVRHVGSLSGCGGNPNGLARCEGSGNCGRECQKCGAGTHWRCCGSTALGSRCCLRGTTREQAEANEKIGHLKYDPANPLPVYVEGTGADSESEGEDDAPAPPLPQLKLVPEAKLVGTP